VEDLARQRIIVAMLRVELEKNLGVAKRKQLPFGSMSIFFSRHSAQALLIAIARKSTSV
jgi:hypothetical protein